jgi:hypothetical protein
LLSTRATGKATRGKTKRIKGKKIEELKNFLNEKESRVHGIGVEISG